MRLSTGTLCVAVLGFVSSVTAIAREHPSHRDVAHIIKSRQAHIPKAKSGELLQKRTLNIMNSFQQAQTDVEVHTREIKSLCLLLPKSSPSQCGIIGNLINTKVGLCQQIMGGCFGHGIIWPPFPPKPSGGGGGWVVPGWPFGPPSCQGAAGIFSGCLTHLQGCASNIAGILHLVPQHSTSILASLGSLNGECASVQQGTNKVLPGFLSHVKQMNVNLDSTSPAGEVNPLGLDKLFPGVNFDQ